MQQPPPTKSGTSRLSDVARHVIKPEGIVSTGWPAVRNTCRQIGLGFDSWQDGAGRLIVAKRSDGLYAADTIVISIPRQVGKTYLIGAIVFALCIIFPGLTVVWTAHRFKTARETFNSMKAMAGRAAMKPHVDRVVRGAGDEAIWFSNGSRILFGARERGFGRGFAHVDVLVLDEGQILTENAMDDMVPATNASPNPLIIVTGTPPKPSDPSEVFSMLRQEAIDGESEETLYIEFSADRDAEPLDRDQWRKANPSHPKRTSARAILRMKKNLSLASFLREALGIWDEKSIRRGAFAAGAWEAAELEGGARPSHGAVGVTVDVETGEWGSLAAVGVWDDGSYLLSGLKRQRGTRWMIRRAKQIQRKTGAAVIVDERGPASHLIQPMRDEGIHVTSIRSEQYQQACADIYQAVSDGTATHMGDAELTAAVAVAEHRKVGDRWRWALRGSSGDISMLDAATLAWHGRDLAYDIEDSFLTGDSDGEE